MMLESIRKQRLIIQQRFDDYDLIISKMSVTNLIGHVVKSAKSGKGTIVYMTGDEAKEYTDYRTQFGIDTPELGGSLLNPTEKFCYLTVMGNQIDKFIGIGYI